MSCFTLVFSLYHSLSTPSGTAHSLPSYKIFIKRFQCLYHYSMHMQHHKHKKSLRQTTFKKALKHPHPTLKIENRVTYSVPIDVQKWQRIYVNSYNWCSQHQFGYYLFIESEFWMLTFILLSEKVYICKFTPATKSLLKH